MPMEFYLMTLDTIQCMYVLFIFNGLFSDARKRVFTDTFDHMNNTV
jgi:hypothetical protein